MYYTDYNLTIFMFTPSWFYILQNYSLQVLLNNITTQSYEIVETHV